MEVRPPLEGRYPSLYRGRCGALARHLAHRTHPGALRRGAPVGDVDQREVRQRPRRHERQSGGADGRCRAEGHLRERLAGCRRRQQRRPDVSRPEPLSRGLGAQLVPPPEQRADSRRPDPSLRRQERHELVRSAHRRRRSRIRRHAERLRADEGHDRSGRGLRSL